MSLRTKNEFLLFDMESDGRVTIRCDNMDLSGDFVQALADYLGLDDLKATCDFPEECAKLENLLVAADDLQSVRQRQGLFFGAFLVVFWQLLHTSTMSQTITDIFTAPHRLSECWSWYRFNGSYSRKKAIFTFWEGFFRG